MSFGRVLVTGGAGFIGSHLVEALLARGARVCVLDDFSTGRRSNLEAVRDSSALRLVEGDLVEGDELEQLVREADMVFHLAAAVGVRLVVEQPVRSLRTNVRGTERLLELCARWGRPVLYASSSEVYGKRARTPMREDDELSLGAPSVARWGYACSKALGEWAALARHAEQGLPVVIARFFNAVGARQTGRYGMVLPRMARSALLGEPIRIYGDGTQTRCFCHVRDTVQAVLELGARVREPQVGGRIFNVGNDQEIAIGELAERVRAAAHSRSPLERTPYEQVYGPGFEDLARRRPCLERLEQATGFRPRTPLEVAIADVLAATRAELESAPDLADAAGRA